jgi:type II secretory pathway component GspD/PulD (secretin)
MTLLVVGVLLAGTCTPAAAQKSGNDAVKSKGATPPKWEYKALTKAQVADLGKKDFAAGLNKLGDEGWELVALEPGLEGRSGRSSGQTTFYFKRPAARTAETPPGTGELKVFKLKHLSAAHAAKVLQEVLAADPRRTRIVSDVGTNQVLAYAPATDLLMIEKILTLLDVPARVEALPGAGEFKTFRLKHATATQAAKVLQQVLGPDDKRTRIVADETTNQVLVSAPVAVLFDVAKILELLDVPPAK